MSCDAAGWHLLLWTVVSLAVTELQCIHMTTPKKEKEKKDSYSEGHFGGKTPVVFMTSNMSALDGTDT